MTDKVIEEFENLSSDDSPKCDYSPSDKWLGEHMD